MCFALSTNKEGIAFNEKGIIQEKFWPQTKILQYSKLFKMKKNIPFLIFLLVCGWTTAQETEKPDLDEIARQMSNPTLPMMNITTFLEYQQFTGSLPDADNQSLSMFALQPPLPIPFKNGRNLIIRPLIPIIFNQPVLMENGFEKSGLQLGNIALDVLYGGTNEKGILSGFGMVMNIPTASNPGIRSNFAIGPSGMIGIMRKWGVLLLLLTQSWDISGDIKTSRLGGQYAIAFSLPKGWQLVSSPPFTYNWDTKELTLPLGGGPFRTIMIGKTPTKIGLMAFYYVSQPDVLGPQWSIRLQIQPSIKRPW